jgi:hypothetical protein
MIRRRAAWVSPPPLALEEIAAIERWSTCATPSSQNGFTVTLHNGGRIVARLLYLPRAIDGCLGACLGGPSGKVKVYELTQTEAARRRRTPGEVRCQPGEGPVVGGALGMPGGRMAGLP